MKHLLKHTIDSIVGLECFLLTYQIDPARYQPHIEKLWLIIEEMREQVRKDTKKEIIF